MNAKYLNINSEDE